MDVAPGQVNSPIIGFQPGANDGALNEYIEGQTILPIQVTAGTTDMIPQDRLEWAAELSIQWYQNEKPTTEGALQLDPENYGLGATSPAAYPLPAFSDRADSKVFTYNFPNGFHLLRLHSGQYG